jgi:hypothetical protein
MTAIVRTTDTAPIAPRGVVARDAQSRFLRWRLPHPVAANEDTEAPARPSVLVARRTRQRRRMNRS